MGFPEQSLLQEYSGLGERETLAEAALSENFPSDWKFSNPFCVLLCRLAVLEHRFCGLGATSPNQLHNA
ncbi:hypothetical protein [Rhodoblastus sp.]|uniref:hypothetical protein n=1 Tax=Rhodoblastus sp. TaxID=1962975 RepID=UPI003F967361